MSLIPESYSLFDRKILDFLGSLNCDRSFVDIGASDGISESNTYLLAKLGYAGVSYEYDETKFNVLEKLYASIPNVRAIRERVTPDNVVSFLQSVEIPKQFGFLSLDIDGYDAFVLDKILQFFRPSLICAELNEKIPYPVSFSVLYEDSYSWVGDHFYGFSIAKAEEISKKHGYTVLEVDYNNIFLVPCELSKDIKSFEQAYLDGYVNAADRLSRFYYNTDVDHWLLMKNPMDIMADIVRFYAKYEGKYSLEILNQTGID